MRNIIAFVFAFLLCATAQAQGIKNNTYSKSRVVLADGLNSTGPLLAEDSNTVSHVYWSEYYKNYILYSADLTNAAWDTSNFCTQTANQGPPGYTDLDLIDCSGPPADFQQIAQTFPVTNAGQTGCGTFASQTGEVELYIRLTASIGSIPTASPRTCWRSDGVPCGTLTGTGAYHKVGMIGTSPVRVCVSDASIVNGSRFTVNTVGGLPFLAGRISMMYGVAYPEYVETTSAVVTGKLVDTLPNAWTMNGTVPQVAAGVSPFVPGKAGAGPYSAANSYQGPTTLGEWAGDFSISVVFKPGAIGALEVLASKMSTSVTEGWMLRRTAGGVWNFYLYDGALKGIGAAGADTPGGINVLTVGKSGGTCYSRLNGEASGSVACGTMTAATAQAFRIGLLGTNGNPATTTTIYEILASTTPYSDALHAARFNAVFGHLPGPVSVTRADPLTYTANGFVWSAPPAAMAISASGAEVWKGSTNYVLQSGTISTAASLTVPWANTGTGTYSTVAGAPDGSSWTEHVAGSSTDAAYQTTAVTSSVGPFTVAAQMVKASGSGDQSILVRCPLAPASCSCSTSDGRSCTAATVNTTDCRAVITATTTPVRVSASATCTTASTAPLIILSGGVYGTGGAAGTGRFGMASLEASAYPTPYIATTGTATARAATVASVPLPALGNKWCISVTATPGSGRAWNLAGNIAVVWSNYVGALTNSANLVNVGGTMNFNLYDSAGGAKLAAYAHAATDSLPRRITACNNNGTPALYWNGVSVGTASGIGTGLQTATLTPLYVGNQNGASQFDGSITNLKVCRMATKASECP